jgi:hypothetical protein
MIRPDTVTVVEHSGAAPLEGQLLPAVAELTPLTRRPLPVRGVFTTTEYRTVAVAPTARFPVQVRLGGATVTVPTSAVTPGWRVASSMTSASESVNVAPVTGAVPSLVTVTV